MVYIKAELDAVNNVNRLLYSADGKNFTPAGDPFAMNFGFWKGPYIGLFSYNTAGDGGDAAFDWFRYNYE